MMRYGAYQQRFDGVAAYGAPLRVRDRGDGYQYSLLPPPALAQRTDATTALEPYTVRAVAPSLRPLMARTGNRCPECTGPLVSGEGCVACPVCGFRRQGR